MTDEPRFNMSRAPCFMAIGKPLDSREMLANLAQWLHFADAPMSASESYENFWRGAFWGLRQAIAALQDGSDPKRRRKLPVARDLVFEIAKTAKRILDTGGAHG